jgi:hypothetical protein
MSEHHVGCQPALPRGGAAAVSDAAFVRAFERGELVADALGHASHLRLALACLEESTSVEEAADRMASGLRRLATAAGHPEKYHHTITLFWMHMIARLLDKNLVLTYYSHERIWSDAARTSWLEPDLRTLDGPPADSSNPPGDTSHRPVSR